MSQLRRGDPTTLQRDLETNELIDETIRRLSSRISLDALVLIGSRARGDALDDSDWDLAVISSDFDGLNQVERGSKVVDCILPHVELVYFTPAELLGSSMSYLRCAVLEEGIPLIDRGAFAAARAKYEADKRAGLVRFSRDKVEFRQPGGTHDAGA